MSEDTHATTVTVDKTQIEQRIEQLSMELVGLRDKLSRTREFLLQASYAHERDWPCPRCHKPMEGYEEGIHACLAIERVNETETMRSILQLETELAELHAVNAELAEGVIYQQRPLPEVLLSVGVRHRTEQDLQTLRLAAKRALWANKNHTR